MLKFPKILNELEWNKKQLSFDDALAVCRRFGIQVFYHEGISEGLHFIRRGTPVIVLNRFLSGAWLNFVAWHEVSHFLLGHEGLRYFVKGSLGKAEQQANIVGICALIPEPMLCEFAFNSSEIWLFPKELIALRLKMFEKFGV